MNPEVIVRALAASAEPCARSNGYWCAYCALCGHLGGNGVLIDHHSSCLWRMAREWVAAQSQEPEGDPIDRPAGELQELADPPTLLDVDR